MDLVGVKVENFKAIRKVDLPLNHVNILVGGNGSGKSSVLQAIHLACCLIRQTQRIEEDKTSTVGVEDLDYLPTDNYHELGHLEAWGKTQNGSCSQVNLYFHNSDQPIIAMSEAECRMHSARNAGISITGNVQNSLSGLLRDRRKFFSSYIPGISGIPNKEEKKSKKVILRNCSFGDSNVILRNALLLLKEMNQNNIDNIERWIGGILSPIKIEVSHDADFDLYIKCEVLINGAKKPIELLGTGYIQLIQIFCYILLFKPGILLIDEPDIHLHPNVQERLANKLLEIAIEENTKIILSTHSPFILRGASSDISVYWLDKGRVTSTNRSVVELALGWGAFGKSIIIVSEDSDNDFLRVILKQWPDLEQSISILPGQGYKNIPTPKQARELKESLGGKFKIVIHRDRDSLTNEEVNRIQREYVAEGVNIWFPLESDIEAYFCNTSYISDFLGIDKEEAHKYIHDVLETQSAIIADQFSNQRAAHNQELYKTGGSPSNQDVWATFQGRPLKGAKGKTVFKQIKNKSKNNMFSAQNIFFKKSNVIVAQDFKDFLNNLI